MMLSGLGAQRIRKLRQSIKPEWDHRFAVTAKIGAKQGFDPFSKSIGKPPSQFNKKLRSTTNGKTAKQTALPSLYPKE